MREIFRKIAVLILNWEAQQYVQKNKPDLIFVCGIINRSNTKEEIIRKLQAQGKAARGSFKGYNAAIGLPLSILNLEAGYHSAYKWFKLLWRGYKISQVRGLCQEIIVLEVSVINEQESKQIMANYQPKMLIFTDFEAKVSKKDAILAGFKALIVNLRAKGTILINGDYEELKSLQDNSDNNFVIFGTQNEPEILLNKICEQEKSIIFSYINEGKEHQVMMDKFGIHNMYSRLIAEYLGDQ